MLKLLEYPEGIEVLVESRIEKELYEILEKSGKKNWLVRKLRKRILMLMEWVGTEKINQCSNLPGIEKLRHVDNLYSMHVRDGQINMRKLFVIIERRPCLLCAFVEKSSKKGSRDSYALNIRKADERVKRIKEGNSNAEER